LSEKEDMKNHFKTIFISYIDEQNEHHDVAYKNLNTMERRKFVKSVGMGTAALYLGNKAAAATNLNNSGSDENLQGILFPSLPYAYDALEPYIDARTLEIHYDKHHRTYYNNLVNAVKGTSLETVTIENILKNISTMSDAIRNNGGGYYNHILYWNNLGKGPSSPSAELTKVLVSTFGSFDKFKEAFSNSAKTRFGSGWAWLYMSADKKLAIGSTPNQDNTLMDLSPIKGAPLLTIDVWEHAYYLKYQNKRADYINAFWNVVNWDEVGKRYQAALK
jgi:Fe-Mn family superoxide dismutase